MSNTLSRRALVAGAATAAVVTTAAIAENHPDPVVPLIAERHRVEADACAVQDRYDETIADLERRGIKREFKFLIGHAQDEGSNVLRGVYVSNEEAAAHMFRDEVWRMQATGEAVAHNSRKRFREAKAKWTREMEAAGAFDLAAAAERAWERLGELDRQIAVTPATSADGIVGKLRMMIAWHGHVDDFPVDEMDTDERLMRQACQDVLALGARR